MQVALTELMEAKEVINNLNTDLKNAHDKLNEKSGQISISYDKWNIAFEGKPNENQINSLSTKYWIEN